MFTFCDVAALLLLQTSFGSSKLGLLFAGDLIACCLQSSFLVPLLQAIKDLDLSRRSQGSLLLINNSTSSSSQPSALQLQTPPAVAHDSRSTQNYTSKSGMPTDSSAQHTELLECCCLAVINLAVAPGQSVVDQSMFAVLDDIQGAWSVVAHDEGLQLIRWGAWTWYLLYPMETGKH